MTRAIAGALMLTRLVWSMLMAMCLLTTAAVASGNVLLSFSVRGKPVAQLSMDQLKQKAPVIQITVWEPHEDKNVTYEGFDIAKLFAAVYGDQWRKIDEALFNEGRTLTSAIRESQPAADATSEVQRARAEARSTILSIGS